MSASHRRRAFFAEHARPQTAGFLGLVRVVLAEFQLLEPVNDLRPQPPAQQQRRDRRARAAHRDLVEQAQKRQPRTPPGAVRPVQNVLAQVIEHLNFSPLSRFP